MPYTNICSAVKPLYYASDLFELAPVLWRTEKKNGFIRAGLVKLLWIVLLTLVLFPFTCYGISLSVPKTDNIFRIIRFTIFQIPLHLSCIITLFVGLTINRSKLPQLLYKIIQVDRVRISGGIGWFIYRKTRARIVLQLFVFVFVIVLSLWMFDLSKNCGLHCYHAYSGILPFLVNTMKIIQFLNFVMILRTKYKLVNDYLTSLLPALKINENTGTSYSLRATVVNFIPKGVLEVKPLCSSLLLNKRTQRELKVHLLRHIYSRLYDISLSISST
jgi:hypothetical protein